MTGGCATCTRVSSNKKWNCPPHMSDGRLYTDYRPRCDVHLEDMKPMSSSYDFRQYMMHNAEGLIGRLRNDAFSRAQCGPCMEPYNVGTMMPEGDAFVCDKISCRRVSGAAGGMGTGRDYGMTPVQKKAQDAFLAHQIAVQNAMKTNGGNKCVGPTAYGYYPLPGLNLTFPNQPEARWAVPGGGRPPV